MVLESFAIPGKALNATIKKRPIVSKPFPSFDPEKKITEINNTKTADNSRSNLGRDEKIRIKKFAKFMILFFIANDW